MQANEKKRSKDEKDIAHRLRPLAKLQTAEDYETFVDGIIYESVLRKRIQELQLYRRMGLTTAADIERYESDVAKRVQAKAQLASNYSERLQFRVGSGPVSTGPDARRGSAMSVDEEGHKDGEAASRPLFKKQPAPLNLANSPALHLLTAAEQTLCSSLRIMPKQYLTLKELLVREYARRGGNLRRREAREMLKIDVNKTSKLWDFLHQAGFLNASFENEPPAVTNGMVVNGTSQSFTYAHPQQGSASFHRTPSLPINMNGISSSSGSPTKDPRLQNVTTLPTPTPSWQSS